MARRRNFAGTSNWWREEKPKNTKGAFGLSVGEKRYNKWQTEKIAEVEKAGGFVKVFRFFKRKKRR